MSTRCGNILGMRSACTQQWLLLSATGHAARVQDPCPVSGFLCLAQPLPGADSPAVDTVWRTPSTKPPELPSGLL